MKANNLNPNEKSFSKSLGLNQNYFSFWAFLIFMKLHFFYILKTYYQFYQLRNFNY